MRTTKSEARTNKLHCSFCREKIAKGDTVIFVLNNGRMEDCYCEKCDDKLKIYDMTDDIEDSFSIGDSYSLGQD